MFNWISIYDTYYNNIIIFFYRFNNWNGYIRYKFTPIAAVFLLIGSLFSTRNKYTRTFIKTIETKLESCSSLSELLQIKEYFMTQAIENNMFRLSWPITLKSLLSKINNQIEILNKIK